MTVFVRQTKRPLKPETDVISVLSNVVPCDGLWHTVDVDTDPTGALIEVHVDNEKVYERG